MSGGPARASSAGVFPSTSKGRGPNEGMTPKMSGRYTMDRLNPPLINVIAVQHRLLRDSLRLILAGILLSTLAMMNAPPAAQAQAPAKPNILFIMGDDIGWMQPSIYHRGLMVGETPNIDRIGNEG